MSNPKYDAAKYQADLLADNLHAAFWCAGNETDEYLNHHHEAAKLNFADLVLKMADLGIHPKPTPGAARNKKANASGIAQDFYRLREVLRTIMWEMAHVQNQLKDVDFDKIRRIGEDALAGKTP